MTPLAFRTCFRISVGLSACLAQVAFADQTWTTTAAGTHDWNASKNWTSAVPGSKDTATFSNTAKGEQTVNGTGGTVKSLDVNSSSASRMFAAGLSLSASNAIFRAGINRFDGDLTLTGGSSTFSRFGTSANTGPIFDIYGNVDASGLHAFCVAQNNYFDNNAHGLIRLYDGGSLKINTPAGSGKQTASLAGLLLGHSGGKSNANIIRAGYQQLGGTAEVGRLIVGFEKNAAASVVVADGQLTLPYISADSRFRIGHNGYGLFKQLGGEVAVMTNTMQFVDSAFDTAAFELGSSKGVNDGLKGAQLYQCGGLFRAGRDMMLQGVSSTKHGNSVAPVSVSVGGSGVMDLRRLIVGGNETPGRASVNLNEGGVLKAFLVTNKVVRTGVGEISGNGGTLVFKSAEKERAQFLGLEYLNVYEKGLTLDCQVGAHIGTATDGAVLRTPTGYGVESISITSAQDYRYDPFLVIEGGSGSNATAVALLDYGTRKITNVVVTCRGEGYKADDKLTLKITSPVGDSTRPDGVVAASSAIFTLTPNKSGALVKTGPQRLAVYKQPEFDGAYEVREGLMIQSTTAVGSPKLSALVVGGGASSAEFQCASDNRTTVSVTKVLNPRAVLTLKGNAKLRMPIGRKDAPNVQEFAALNVSGTGNRIWTLDSESETKNPIEIRFGALSFEKDSQLVLKTNENYRVYAPAAMAGQFLKNVTFEGLEDRKIGLVAPNGQIVPQSSTGLTIIVR